MKTRILGSIAFLLAIGLAMGCSETNSQPLAKPSESRESYEAKNPKQTPPMGKKEGEPKSEESKEGGTENK